MTAAQAVNHIGIAVHSIDAHRAFCEGTPGAVFEGVEASRVRRCTARVQTPD
jgi:hypothetical protein